MQAIICPGHTRPIVDIQFSSLVGEKDNYFLISACKDGKPMLRLGSTGDWIGTYEGHKGAVFCATIDASAQLAVTGSADFTAKLWDATKGTLLSTLEHDHIVRAVDLGAYQASTPTETSTDVDSAATTKPSHLLTATNNKIISLWDMERPDASLLKLNGPTGSIRKVTWLPDGHRCFSISEDKQLRVWDLRSGECTEAVTLEEYATDVDVSADRRDCLVTRKDKVIELDLTRSHLLECPALVPGSNAAIDLPCHALSACRYPTHLPNPSYTGADGETIHSNRVFVCGGMDNTVYKCSLDSGEVLEKYPKVHFGSINCMRFSPDGHLYATASDDGTLRLFQTFVGESYGLWRRVEKTSAEAEPAAAVANESG